MNAKKIMGAVLVALLAAALFVGAGAAAITADVDGKVVFVNQKLDKDNYSGSWVGPNGAYIPAAAPGDLDSVYFGVAGTYTAKVGTETITITVKAPELAVSGVAGTVYTFIPGDLYENSGAATVYIQNPTNVPYDLYFTDHNAQDVDQEVKTVDLGTNYVVKKYKIQAEFNASYFIVGTTPEQLITAPVYFSVVDAQTAVSISAAATTVLKGDNVVLTVTGQPGVNYNVTFKHPVAFEVNPQIGFTFEEITNGIQFTMPAGGKATFVVKTTQDAESTEKITVKADIEDAKQATVTIEFKKGTITAQAEKETYFVGDEIKVTGTSTAGDIEYIALTGNNFKNESFIASGDMPTLTNKKFEFTFNTGDVLDAGKKLDVGTYTLSVGNGAGVNATVLISLKQPFISILDAPEVIAQGEEEVEIIINAEAAPEVGYYIFGNNFYYFNEGTTFATEEDGTEIKNQFVITLDDALEEMAPGQYFAVFQHPMNNGILDVSGSTSDWIINTPSGAEINVYNRQTANAAQALCDAIDSQGIDDMYVKYSFLVVDKSNSYSISDIPSEVVKGDKIVISGVDTVNAGKTVGVEMLSTAFTAVPKEESNAAAFIVVSTVIDEDGIWEVTLDTSALAVDEYNVAVKVAGEIQKTAAVNVVEGSEPVTPTDEPTVVPTDEPVTPTEAPATPGFGALAALAGLGAVAVLLLRRE